MASGEDSVAKAAAEVPEEVVGGIYENIEIVRGGSGGGVASAGGSATASVAVKQEPEEAPEVQDALYENVEIVRTHEKRNEAPKAAASSDHVPEPTEPVVYENVEILPPSANASTPKAESAESAPEPPEPGVYENVEILPPTPRKPVAESSGAKSDGVAASPPKRAQADTSPSKNSRNSEDEFYSADEDGM